jgi:hypothetical protein
MKIGEIIRESADEDSDRETQWNSLVTVLELMKRQGKTRGIPVKYNLQAFINLIRNAGPNDPALATFNYDMLKQAREDSDQVKNLVDFNDTEVTVKVTGDEDTGMSADSTGGSENTVSNMAKSALKKRT